MPSSSAEATASDAISRSRNTRLVGVHLAASVLGRLRSRPAAFDLFEGTLYCSACNDVVYHPRFQQVQLQQKAQSLEKTGRPTVNGTKDSLAGQQGGPSICRGEWQH